MKEFNGTPGPWVASKTGRIIGPVRRDDDQSYGMILPVAWVEFDVESGHHQANANLIAAAPDLLEALQACIGWVNNGVARDAHEKAVAAISKALGEE